jgi:hypothetical protein
VVLLDIHVIPFTELEGTPQIAPAMYTGVTEGVTVLCNAQVVVHKDPSLFQVLSTLDELLSGGLRLF